MQPIPSTATVVLPASMASTPPPAQPTTSLWQQGQVRSSFLHGNMQCELLTIKARHLVSDTPWQLLRISSHEHVYIYKVTKECIQQTSLEGCYIWCLGLHRQPLCVHLEPCFRDMLK